MYILKEELGEGVFGAGAEGRRDATTNAPQVREVGMGAENVDPHLWR
jgi:hypothetical protein